jgi:hypothetical protein
MNNKKPTNQTFQHRIDNFFKIRSAFIKYLRIYLILK